MCYPTSDGKPSIPGHLTRMLRTLTQSVMDSMDGCSSVKVKGWSKLVSAISPLGNFGQILIPWTWPLSSQSRPITCLSGVAPENPEKGVGLEDMKNPAGQPLGSSTVSPGNGAPHLQLHRLCRALCNSPVAQDPMLKSSTQVVSLRLCQF